MAARSGTCPMRGDRGQGSILPSDSGNLGSGVAFPSPVSANGREEPATRVGSDQPAGRRLGATAYEPLTERKGGFATASVVDWQPNGVAIGRLALRRLDQIEAAAALLEGMDAIDDDVGNHRSTDCISAPFRPRL